MRQIYYINHKGQKIDFLKPPYHMQTGDIFSFEWDYETVEMTIDGNNGGKITRFFRGIKTKEIVHSIMADSKQAYYSAINTFHDITEIDIVNMIPGRLYVDDYYLKCYLYASEKSEWEYGIELLDNTAKIVAEYPMWMKDEEYHYQIGEDKENTYGFLDTPYDVPYDLAPDGGAEYIDLDHYAPCHFDLIIFGYCVNPRIEIRGHIYMIETTVYEGEYIAVSSVNETVTKVLNDGTRENIYNSRYKDDSLFQKIQPGRNVIVWNQTFGFDITVHKERSEPLCIL